LSRQLGDALAAAWHREQAPGAAALEDELRHRARRTVAERCLYGVDRNPLAVHLAKLSLWLTTLARDKPFTFVDHALRHGDSLVGLDLEQIRLLDLNRQPQEGARLVGVQVQNALRTALSHRLALRTRGDAQLQDKESDLKHAEEATLAVRALADALALALFAPGEQKNAAKARSRKSGAGAAGGLIRST
jgi:hypothetical protein